MGQTEFNEKHGPNVFASLAKIESRQQKLLQLAGQMFSAYGGALYPVDLLAAEAIKRILSTTSAFRLLVESFNMISCRSLLRLQIDTAIRFYSIFLVKEPHDFVSHILRGEQINHKKDRDGKRMTDTYLISKLASEYPWLPAVYKNLCGYVHLSEQHLLSPVERLDEQNDSFTFVISEKDTKFPEWSWREIIDVFNEATDIFIKYLEGWIFTKAHPEVAEKIKGNKFQK